MKRVGVATAVIIAILSCGCRNQAAQELLERELRRQEDRIYELQDKLDEYKRLTAALECENRACQQGDYSLDSGMSSGSIIRSAPRDDRPSRSRDITPSPGDVPHYDEHNMTPPSVEPPPPFKRPEISPPNADQPEGLIPHKDSAPPAHLMPPDGGHTSTGGDELRLPPLTVPAINDASPEEVTDVGRGAIRSISDRASGGTVTAITLNREQTGGYNADGTYGDEGIMVVIEPRDSDGEIVDVPGKVSVVVIDPMLQGEAARLARWDIPFDDIKARMHAAPIGSGLPLQLRWKGQPPQHRSLDVFVRYTTPDGRRFDADQSIEVEPLAMSSPRLEPQAEWTGTPTPAPRRTPQNRSVNRGRSPAPTAARPRSAPTPAERSETETSPRSATRSEWAPYR